MILNTFVSTYHLDCSLVHSSCEKCSGTKYGDCRQCAEGWFLRGGMCEGDLGFHNCYLILLNLKMF